MYLLFLIWVKKMWIIQWNSAAATMQDISLIIFQAGTENMKGFTDILQLNELQEMIETANLGAQAISSSPREGDSKNSATVILPLVFAFIGQRFTMDSWALSNIVFDRVRYNGEKVLHKSPSCLDVCFSIFGNSSVVPDIVTKVRETKLLYHSNLLAIREVVDALPETAWKENLCNLWLRLLRILSEPTTGDEFPEAMRTRAWAAKDTETQVASWSQMRHDAVLYAKQSYSAMLLCEYPAGYVDPRPEFWKAFLDMTSRANEILLSDATDDSDVDDDVDRPSTRMTWVLRKQMDILGNWEKALSALSTIALKERTGKPLADAEVSFLRKIVRIEDFGSGDPQYDGWYCQLFYKSGKDSCQEDITVVDVHTNPPDDTSQGSVLHEGIGLPRLMTIAVNSGDDTALYVGPVFSHHEFETEGLQRISDSEWQERVKRGDFPTKPQWKTFIVADA